MPKDAGGAGYHICQSLIAVGTGGLTGRGYMEGMQKLFYLPEASTDFIFANIAEELGFAGAIFILALFVALGVRGMRAGFRSKDSFARLTAFGITTAILLQAFFNISVVLALVPTKGIPLPADLLRRHLGPGNPGQHRHSAQHFKEGGVRKVGNREQGTGNREQGTGNREQGTGNREQGTGNREQGTGNREQGTGNASYARFVKGYDFSRAEIAAKNDLGFSP